MKVQHVAIVMIVGLFLYGGGFAAGNRYGRSSATAGELLVFERRAEHAALQYQVADPASAETALRGFLALLDKLTEGDNELLEPNDLAAERTLTLTRLELLRARVGDDAGAERYAGLAVASCAAAGWRDCSAAGRAAAVEMMTDRARTE